MRNGVFVALIAIGLATTTFLAFQLSRAGTTDFWMLAGGPMVVLAVVGALRAKRDGELSSWLRPAWGDATRGVLGALGMFVLAYGFARITTGGPRESWLARLYL